MGALSGDVDFENIEHSFSDKDQFIVFKARNSSNGKCKVLLHIKSVNLNYIKISFRKTLHKKIFTTYLHQ